MTDQPPSAAPARAPVASLPPDSQLVTALAVVAAITVIALALIGAGMVVRDASVFHDGVLVGLGALATALSAPTGIAGALKASRETGGSRAAGAGQ